MNASSLFEYLSFEKSYDVEAGRIWAQTFKYQTIAISAIYVFVIFTGKHYMKDRQSFGLRTPLAIWSTLLAVFSIFGATYLGSELIGRLLNEGWKYSICSSTVYYGISSYWSHAFAVSKVFELGDTVFIVLRKQPLIFLHWYHHITVMMYTFDSYSEHCASGRWYMAMNYTVHSVMYTYYALRAWGFRFPKAVNMSITALQITQMIAGLIVQLSVFAIKYSGGECQQSYTNFAFGLAMYVSYFFLFIQFFYRAYASPVKSSQQNGHPFGSNGVKSVKAEHVE